MKWLNDFFYKYLGFNKRERNGILILCSILFALSLIKLWYSNQTSNVPFHLEKIDSLSQQIIATKQISGELLHKSTNQLQDTSSSSLFPFNPNRATEDDFKQLGLKEKVIITILHFREKGGKFRKKEDLKKIYGLNEELYVHLEPYILIDGEPDHFLKSTPTKYSITKQPIELNAADSVQLVSLNGIGPSLSRKILKFRNALGGFYDVIQLKEVYGMKDTLFKLFYNDLILNTEEIKKIKINDASIDEMKKHPYISYMNATSIVNYRSKHGKIKSAEDLKKIGSISNEIIAKLDHYLNYD